MTEHPTSHEGRQPLAARPQERTRPRQEARPAPAAASPAAAPAAAAVPAPAGPAPQDPAGVARREGDRLRFVGAATRRIARGIDLDEIVLGLCRATVPTFSDAILVYLRDPLPVGDERPVDPFVLRLRRTDRLRLGRVLGSAGGQPLGEVARDAVGAGFDGHVVFA
ncbi:serine/threonine protein phosphatase, partial [Streptomyces purpureus]